MRKTAVLCTVAFVLAALLPAAPTRANTLDLYQPFGMAVTAGGTTYTANPFRHEIDKFDAAGSRLATFGSFGTGDGAFRGCSGVALDSLGRLYVADTGNSRIVRLSDQGTSLQWEGVLLGPAAVDFPRDLVIDAQDRLFVVDDTDTVKVFDLAGTPLGIFPEGRNFLGGTGTEPGKLRRPYGIFVDHGGNLYVADSYNDRIQKFDAGGNFLLAFGTPGTAPGEFLQPRDVAVNSEGRIYVADTHNHRIQEFDPQGAFISRSDDGGWALAGVPSAETLAVDAQDQLHYTVAGGTGASETNTDHTPPTIVIEGVAPGAAYAGAVTPVVTVSDLNPRIERITLNGEAFQSGTTVGAEGMYQLAVFAEDAFGNSSSRAVVFYLDHTAPRVRFSGAANGLSYDRDVTVTFQVHDNFDPVPTVESSHASGTTFTESGSHTVSVTATDWVGNQGTYTLTFEIFKLPNLITNVGGSTLPDGLKNSLLSKLQEALALVQAGQHKAATNVLGAFINAVQAQRGKKIPIALADQWIRFAENLIRLIDSRWLKVVRGELLIGRGAAELATADAAALDAFLLGLGQKGISRLVLAAYAPSGPGTGFLSASDRDLTGFAGRLQPDPGWAPDLGLVLGRAKSLGMGVVADVRAFRTAAGTPLDPRDPAHRAHLAEVVDHLLAAYPSLDGIVMTDFAYAQSDGPAFPAELTSLAGELSARVRAAQKSFFVSVRPAADAAASAEVLSSTGQDYPALAESCDGLYLETAFNQDADQDGWADFDPSWVGQAAAYVRARIRPTSPACAVIPRIQTYDLYEPYEDGNGDGSYSAGEIFTDVNGNGVWDRVLTTQAAQVGDAIDALAVEDVAAVAIDHLAETSAAEWDAVLNSHPR